MTEAEKELREWMRRMNHGRSGGKHEELLAAVLVAYSDPYTTTVREFHERMGLVVRDAPSLGTPAEREERVRLMLEELLEVSRALCVSIWWDDEYPLESISDVTISGTGIEPDGASVLHELADLQVTVSGTAVQFGLPLLPAVRAVHAANMQKAPQGPGRKPLKPEGWKPADVSRVLQPKACDPEMHKVNGFCTNCSDGWL